jgi:hypothetical protein
MKWTCPSCGPIKKLRLARRIARGFFNHEEIHALTLTQVLGSQRNIIKDFQTWRELVKKRYHTKLKYFWVKEFTRNGQRHLHMLFTPDTENFLTGEYRTDVKRISNLWSEVTLNESYRVWINKKQIENSAGYLFKYLTKAFGVELFPKRVWDGHNYSYDYSKCWKPKERRYGFCSERGFRPIHELPLLGNFWEIIGHPTCKPYRFHKINESEDLIFLEEYVDSTGLFAT